MIECKPITVAGSTSILGFAEEGGGTWPAWYRFLTLDGKNAYRIGNICGTCHFFFERLEGADKTLDASALTDALGAGLETLDTAAGLSRILPDGEYTAMLLRVAPRHVLPGDASDYFAHEQTDAWGMTDYTWGLPHYPRTPYYRSRTLHMSPHTGLYEFIIPMLPPARLDADRLRQYRRRNREMPLPTAVAVSVLDVKEFHDYTDDSEEGICVQHWCLAHYLLDGHHKTHAAALEGLPLSLLSFLALGKGVSLEEERLKLPELLDMQS